MKIILIIMLPILHLIIDRTDWKINPWLFIDIYIGRKNFYKFLNENGVTCFNDIVIDKEMENKK